MHDARLYIFTVPPLGATNTLQIMLSIDSRMEGALEKVREKCEKGVVINFVGFMEGSFIKSEIEKVGGATEIAEPNVEPAAERIEKPATTREQFIQNILLVADDFVTDERDKRSLKRILGRVTTGVTNKLGDNEKNN